MNNLMFLYNWDSVFLDDLIDCIIYALSIRECVTEQRRKNVTTISIKRQLPQVFSTERKCLESLPVA